MKAYMNRLPLGKHLDRRSKAMRVIQFLIVFVSLMLAFVSGTKVCSADVIYHWEGQCSVGCVGTSQATITLADGYVPGAPLRIAFTGIGPDYLKRLQIVDNVASFDFNGFYPGVSGPFYDWHSCCGALPLLSGSVQLDLGSHAMGLSTLEDGRWGWGVEFQHGATGTGSTFTYVGSTAAPEPSTLALMAFMLWWGWVGGSRVLLRRGG